MTADDIIAAARACLGTPFQHQGRLIGVGMDCAGVAIHALHTSGGNPIDVPGYGETPNKGALQSALDAQPDLEVVAFPAIPQAGDVLLFRFFNEPQHVGICTGPGVIHAYSSVGGCVEHDLCSKWRSRIVRIYRVKGLS